VQGRQATGRTDYVRTAPTSLTFLTNTRYDRVKDTLTSNLHSLAMSSISGNKKGRFDVSFRSDASSRLLFPQVPSNECIHVTLPKMSLRFESLSDAQENRLIELGLEERTVKGKGRVWVGQLDSRSASEVVSFGTVKDYAAMGGTLSVRGIAAMNSTLRIITLGAQTLTLACGSVDERSSGITEVIHGDTADALIVEYSTGTMEEITADDEGNDTVLFPMEPATVLALRALPKVWGSLEDMRGTITHGIFCPFEPNYSQTDRLAMSRLLSEFSMLCTEPEDFEIFDNEFVEMWTKEIALTMEGEFVAHMIACLCLAKRVKAKVFFLTTGSLYEGCILHGTEKLSFKLVGGMTYRALEQADLAEDVSRYAFHSSTLNSILEDVGVGEDEIRTSSIKTMRGLRTIVLGKLGQVVPPEKEASLSKKLLFLNFRERQESVNPSTMQKFLSFVHPTTPTPVPDSVYLDRRAFFSRDAVVVALSMFGVYAPSPITSGQTLLLAVSPNSNKTPSKEPAMLQFAKKELLVAARDWINLARGGSIVQPANKIKRGVGFRGTEKSEIWGYLVGYAGAGLSAKRSEVEASKIDQVIGKRDRDAETSGGRAGRETKTGPDFSMFMS